MAALNFPITLGPITLRFFDPGDYKEFYAYWGLPEVARYVRWEPNNPTEAWLGLNARAAGQSLDRPGDRIRPAIVDTATGRILGETMLLWDEGDGLQGEIGFALHPDAQGRGVAHRAASEMLRLGFEDVGLHRICGVADTRNDASIGLLTRLGLRVEASFREDELRKGEWCDSTVLAILDREWRAARD